MLQVGSQIDSTLNSKLYILLLAPSQLSFLKYTLGNSVETDSLLQIVRGIDDYGARLPTLYFYYRESP